MDLLTFLRGQWDRVGAWALALAGAVALLVGWFGVSRTPFPAEQIPYVLSAGVGGLFLLGVAAVLWLSADLRDEWRKLDAIEEVLRANGHAAPPGADAPTAFVPAAVEGNGRRRAGTASTSAS